MGNEIVWKTDIYDTVANNQFQKKINWSSVDVTK